MNIPNRLTIVRVAMIPLFVVAMLWDFPYHQYVALFLFVAACVTDFFDGYLARKYNQITTFGKFMDPLADKLLVCAALSCFLADSLAVMPAWAVIVIISREFIISGFRLVAAEKGVTIAASYWGKVKTVVQMIMSILLIARFDTMFDEILHMPTVSRVMNYINITFIYAAVFLTIISLVDYIYKNRDVMRDVK